MIHTFLVLLLGLFQATACDSNGPSDPDIRGGWDGSVFVPNSPFPVFMHFKLNIENDSISGIGFYELDLDGIFQRDSIEIRGIFRRTEITISGSFEYPTVIFEITGEDGRDDLFVGEIDEEGLTISGLIEIPKLPLPEFSARGAGWALGGNAGMVFERRVTED